MISTIKHWNDFNMYRTTGKQKKNQVYFKSYTVLVFVLKV